MAINLINNSQVLGTLSITGDGNNATTLTESGSGDFTIATVDDLRLDSGGNDIVLRGASSSEFGRLSNSSQTFIIKNITENKDIRFDGNDGNGTSGTNITALTLDMSDGGWAQFNTGISVGNSSATSTFAGKVSIGTIDEVGSDTDKFLMSESGVVTYVSGANLRSYIGAGTGSGTVTGTGSATRVAFWSDTSVLSSNADLYWDNTDDRLGIGISSITSSKLDVYSTTANANGVLRVRQAVASNDPTVLIEHTVAGGNANEDTGLVIKSVGSGAGNQNVLNAYKENGTDYAFKVNGGGDTYSANDAYIEGSVVFSSDDGATCSKVNWLEFVCPDTGTSVNSKIGYLETNFPDNSKVTFGDLAGGDLQIYHNGSNSYIQDTGAGVLYIQGSGNVQIEGINGENMIICNENGSVQLHYDNVQKFQTTSTGVTITGGFSTSASSSCAGLNMTADISMAGNDIALDSNGNIELDTSLTTSQTSGTIIKHGGHMSALTAGKVYYGYASMTAMYWAQASQSSATSAKSFLAMSIGTDADVDGMLLSGVFYSSSHGFTIGTALYLSTSGNLTNTVPSTSNYYARVCGYALDANHIYFNPDNTWVKID